MNLSYRYEMDDPDVIARAKSDDGHEVLILSAPASAIDGQDGPVLIPSMSSDFAIVVLSEEFIRTFTLSDDDTVETMRQKIELVGDVVRASVSYGMAFLNGRLEE